jgi:diguanylate cyclase
MPQEEIVQVRAISEAAVATMVKYEIPATPANYTIWYEYHAGQSPSLQRTIDILFSNRAAFDQNTLQELYSTFFTSEREIKAVRETSVHALKTLQDIANMADFARQDADNFGDKLNGFASDLGGALDNLKELIENLVDESKKMAGRSHYLSQCMRETAGKIVALERNLESAMRDSTLDALTGVGNRKSFDSTIRKEAGEAMNSGDDLALLMIDIDHFKVVNDTWGHQTGDKILCGLAKILTQSVRGDDYVARYGGEEFAVILPRTDGDGARMIAERIRQNVETEDLKMKDLNPPLSHITVSIGAACYEPGDPLAEWVKKTDAALYSAKREGRNRVEFN